MANPSAGEDALPAMTPKQRKFLREMYRQQQETNAAAAKRAAGANRGYADMTPVAPALQKQLKQSAEDVRFREAAQRAKKQAYKKGGYIRSADGCCSRGGTKGKYI